MFLLELFINVYLQHDNNFDNYIFGFNYNQTVHVASLEIQEIETAIRKLKPKLTGPNQIPDFLHIVK